MLHIMGRQPSDPAMAERLRQARVYAGFTKAAEGARRVRAKYGTYSCHENGSRGFDREAAQQYAKAYGVRWEWLFLNQPPMVAGRGNPHHDPFAGLSEASKREAATFIDFLRSRDRQ